MTNPATGEGHQSWWNRQVDERLADIARQIERLGAELREEVRRGDGQAHTVGGLGEKLADLRRSVEELQKQVRDDTVSTDSFRPYRNAAVLLLTLLVTGVIGALLRLVVH